MPTFAEYVPVVSAGVTDGTRRAYGSYWNRVVEQWGARRLDEPTPSEIRQLAKDAKANAVPRRNARGGRGAAENLIAALRCLYRRADAAARLRCAPRIWTASSAWSCSGRRARRSAGSRSPPP